MSLPVAIVTAGVLWAWAYGFAGRALVHYRAGGRVVAGLFALCAAATLAVLVLHLIQLLT
jgi:hypothetical protein